MSLTNKQTNHRQDAKKLRLGLVLFFFISSFVGSFFVEPRVIDLGGGWLVSEIFVGAVLFWPLSEVLIERTGKFWGVLLSSIPLIGLVSIRYLYGLREWRTGSASSFVFGAMIFFGAISMAAYLIFRSGPPPNNH